MTTTPIKDELTADTPDEASMLQKQLEAKDEEIKTLKLRIDVLENLLSKVSAQRVPLPAIATHKPAPRRWSVR